ncbi:MAG: helix-turn-helix domain-containing protein [Acutalibacteraceae bacterium]
MNIDFKLLGSRLAQRRRELGLKQFELAEKAGLSNNYLSSIERGWSIPSLETFATLCMSLNTSPDYFLLGTVRTSDVPQKLIENLKLCSDDNLELIDEMIQVLVRRQKNDY